MKKTVFAAAFFGLACALLGASLYHALTTPWSIEVATARICREAANDKSCAATAQPAIWNRVYPPDVTLAVAKVAKAGGKVVLHLGHVHADVNIDNVQIYLICTVPDPDGKPYEGRGHAASLVLESQGFDGDKEFDVTEKFKSLASLDPDYIKDFDVAFVVVPRNNGVHMTEDSFDVGNTYFEVFDAAGKPVRQERRPKVDAAIHQSDKALGPAPYHAP